MTQKEIETRLLNLERAFLQSQNNAVQITAKADRVVSAESSISRLEETTPKKYSKRAYIGDTQVTFPYADGIISASVSGNRPCGVTITDYEIIVNFDELQEVATVTISII